MRSVELFTSNTSANTLVLINVLLKMKLVLDMEIW